MKEKVEFFQKLLMSFEVAAAITGIVVWKKTTDRRLKYFYAYLLLIAASELTGWQLKQNGYKEATALFYACFVIPCEFLISYWLISLFSKNRQLKNAQRFFTIAGVAVNLVEIIFLRHEKFFFSSLAYLTYSLFLLILLLLFLWEFVKSDQILAPWHKMIFWACIAWLQYYLLTFPLYAFYNLLYATDKDIFMLYWQVQMVLNMLMYFLFCIGILWTNRNFK